MNVGRSEDDSSTPMSIVGSGTTQASMPMVMGPPQRPGTLGTVEHYDLLSLLGEGGMGMVSLARDTRSGDKVALKILKPAVAGSARAAAFFRKEVNHLAHLTHPHIVRVLEAAPDERGGWFVMPYLERGSLDRLIKEKGPLPAEQAIELALQVAEALAFAHSRGIIHRDLKPRNVLLADDGRALLTDFGLARSLVNDELLDVAQPRVEGTLHYMSPQAAAGEQEDTRGDIYALGALLYEMLTGRVPYGDTQSADIAKAIAAGAPTPIRTLSPKAPESLVSVAEWAMARELKDRYARMADVIGDLKLVQGGQAPSGSHGAKDLGRLEARARAMVRHPGVWGTALVLLLGAIGWQVWGHLSPQLKIVRSFSLPQITSWITATVVRWNSEPIPTLLVPAKDVVYEVPREGRMGRTWSIPQSEFGSVFCPFKTDTDGDGFDEVFFSWTRGQTASITRLRANLSPMDFSIEGGRPHPKDLTNQIPPSLLSARGFLPPRMGRDGTPYASSKLLAFLNTGRSKRPRALCCFDYTTGKLDWQTNVGPALHNLVMLDLDADGVEEIVCGGAAPSNGNREPDAGDDEHSCVFAFSQQGQKLWMTNLGTAFGYAEVLLADLDGDRRPELLAHVFSSEVHHATNAPVLGRVVRLDPRNGQIIDPYEPPVCLLSVLPFDIDGDGRSEILCTDCEGYLHVLNGDLTPRERIAMAVGLTKRPGSLDHVALRLRGTARLRRGHRPYVILTTVDTRLRDHKMGYADETFQTSEETHAALIVLDSKLKPVSRCSTDELSVSWSGWKLLIADLEADGEDEILMLSDRVDVLKLAR